jgi:hypothetical protein
MSTRVRLLLAIAAGLVVPVLLACSSRTTVAGTGSQAGNGRVECLVTDYNGTVYSNALVILRRIEITQHDDSVMAQWTKLTDENGFCGFDSLPPGSFVAGCGNRDSGAAALVSKIHSDMDSTFVLYIEPTITYKGRLLAPAGIDPASVSVFVPGCLRSARPDANGFYVLPNVPLGQHDISFRYNTVVNYLPVRVDRATADTIYLKDVAFVQSGSSTNVTYSFYQTTMSQAFSVLFTAYDSAAAPQWYAGKNFALVKYYRVVDGSLEEVDSLGDVFAVLDDFDDGDSLSSLNPVTGHSDWLVITDAKDSGTTQLLPAGTAQHFWPAITDVNAYSGKSFIATFLMGTKPPTLAPYAYISCPISPRGSGYANFTAMTALTFELMGKGNIRVVFRSHKALAGYTPDQWWGQLSVVIPSPPAWQKITILPGDIKAPANSKQLANGLTWASVRDSIDRIEFAAWQNRGDTVVMGLDNIVIHGLSDADFK